MTARHLPFTIRLSTLTSALVLASFISVNTLSAQTADPASQPVVAPISTPQARPAPSEQPANKVTLTAIPPRYGEDGTLKIAPGEKTQIQVRIRNSSDTSMNIRSVARDFIIDEDGQTPIPVTENVSNRWSLSNWITLVPATQTLAPGETGAVNVLIEVPAEGLPGGHYAMITHEPSAGGTIDDTGSAISQQVGTLLYATVDGPINEQAFIRDFSFNDGNFAEFGPVPYKFTIDNESDIHIRPQLGIEIYDVLGRKVSTLQPGSKNIFPLTSRSFEGAWDQIWGTGFYKAELTASYGAQGTVVMATDTFWLLPIRLVLAILLSILTLVAIIISIRRHMIHRQDYRNQKIATLEEKLKQMENDKLKKFED